MRPGSASGAGCVLVTGAARGNGAAIARRLVADGFDLVLLDIDAAALTRLQAELSGEQTVDAVALDLADTEAIERTIRSMRHLTGLVNNAGILKTGSLLTTPDSTLERLWRVNVAGAFACARAAARQMAEAQAGSIVNVASLSAHRGRPGFAAYAATKGAVLAMTRAMAADLAGYGIRVNSVSPGVVRTALNSDWLADQQAVDAAVRAMPLRRLGEPQDVADAVAFLISDQARWMTGVDLIVDGGERNVGSVA